MPEVVLANIIVPLNDDPQIQFVADGDLSIGQVKDVRIIHTSKKDNGDIHYTLAFFILTPGSANKVKVTTEQISRDVSSVDSTIEDVPVGTNVADTEFLELRSKSGDNAIFDSISIEYDTATP